MYQKILSANHNKKGEYENDARSILFYKKKLSYLFQG